VAVIAMRHDLTLPVFLPDRGEGYVLRYEIAGPKVARDGRVHLRDQV